MRYEAVRLPASLLQDCPVPEWSGGTYRALAALAEQRRVALLDCNAQLEQARREQDRQTAEIEGR